MWVRFGDIVSYRMGKTPPREDLKWWNSDVPWVSISDMPEDGHIASTKESVSSFAIKEKFSDCVSPAGTMIMSFKLTVGRVSILDIDAVHNEAIISIFPYADEDNTIQSYLFRLLPTVTQYGDTKNAIKGITLNSTSICNLLIPLPPLSEQKRIVAKIEELLPLVERYGEACTKLEEFNRKFPDDMKKSILQKAIQGKLVEQRPEEGTGEKLYQQIQAEKQKLIKEGKLKKEKPLPEITEGEIPFEIPENWKWVHLSDLGEIVGGGTPKTGDPSLWDDDGIPWLTPADMKNIRGMYASHGERNISQTGLAKSSAQLMPKGTVLYSSRAPIGYIAIAANDICTNQGFKSLVPANTEINKYMYYCLIARTDDIKARASGTTFKEISVVLCHGKSHAVQCRTVFYVRRIIGLHAVLGRTSRSSAEVFDAPVSPYGVSYGRRFDSHGASEVSTRQLIAFHWLI